jgi:hypothetical protein
MPDNRDDIKSTPNISVGSSNTVQLIEHGRDIHMYRVTDIELDILKSCYDSWSLGFCTLCLGAFIGFLIPLVTVQLSDRMCAIFVSLTVISGILTFFFGSRWLRDRKEANHHIKQIKERSTQH